jgi:hypothetical protein
MIESRQLIDRWLERRLQPEARDWLATRRAELSQRFSDRALHITLGMIPRRLGKADLALDDDELAAAAAAREGWDPGLWGIADAARVMVLLETAEAGEQPFPQRFADLCRSAEVGELIALYRGLPLYPQPQALEAQAGEGLRTNMRSVFEAVAHRNPFPREQFSEDRWNHMVLKALFIGSTLAPIQGLDQRANPELARILCDYAHERWAAHRAVTPELWRCVGPFAEGGMLDDLERVLRGEVEAERQAAALALAASPHAEAARRLDAAPELQQMLREGALSWDRIAHPTN